MKSISLRLACGLPTLIVLMSACSPPEPASPQQRADQQTRAACRERADEIFAQQNRAAVYEQNQDLSPFSSSYSKGVTTTGLGEEFGRDQMIDDCIRNKGTDTSPAPAANLAPSAH